MLAALTFLECSLVAKILQTLLDLVSHICNLSTWEAEAGKLPWIEG